MSRRDMANFVPQNGGQLRFGTEVRENAPGDVHVTARECKRIDDRAVYYSYGVFQVRALRNRGYFLTDTVDVRLQTRVIVRAVLGHDLRVGFFAHLDFL